MTKKKSLETNEKEGREILTYQCYHRHSYFTNPRIADSVVSNESYAKRAVELGHGIISTMEHGWQGRYIEGYELAQKYDLKFVFGAEAYWVKDRFEKDRSNCHIYVGAKNERGRQAINDILSEASITGYYAQPRIDVPLILSLPSDDVFVTTACVAYWRYDDIEDITLRFNDHFKHFFLEVQYHNTERQRDLNRRILNLSKKHKIPLIMGTDSHFIKNGDNQERTDYLASKGIEYPDEEGWYLDYPDGDEAYQRFANQCVLSHDEILEAINNTNVFLTVEPYENPCFTKEIKMPTLYPDLTQEQKNQKYSDLVWEKWNAEKHNVPQDRWAEYEDEIRKEIKIVHTTHHADYFLLDYEIVKRGKEKGGVITSSGRGSGVSFYTNKLLGFTDVDRISAKVKMYPERFMSPTRILETKSLADLDLNLGTVGIFAEAQAEVLGEGHSAPMLAYGTMKPKAAWKMYAKSQAVNFDLANKVSEQIEKYEWALKHAGEDEKEDINVLDYIDAEYHDIYTQSKTYLGVASDFKIHPCSYLLYQGDIRREIGLVRIKENICCVMDGKWAEEYKFLKNDLLKVSVVDLIDKIYRRIGIPRHSVRELLDLCPPESNVWDIYKKGCTLGINQVEQAGTSARAQVYAPTNISELCAFVAAIRPGFKSMYKTFERREHFEYGIKALDDLIQTAEMPHSFILYQEMSMAVLNFAGIPMSECYDIIKNIAKKRVEKVLKYKTQFIEGFTKTLIEREGQDGDTAQKVSHDVWQILEDSSSYSFNASHSYSVAIDSLYGAFLKTNYPLQFYEVFLTILQEKGEKDRLNEAKNEAESYFKIKFPPYRFGQDNRAIVADFENNAINNSISAIKGFGAAIGDTLYECGQQSFERFTDVLRWLNQHSVKTSTVEPLIKIDYFAPFGNTNELLQINEMFNFFKCGEAKSISKEKVADSPYLPFIQKHSRGTNDKGKELKSYAVRDIDSLVKDCEDYILSLGIKDMTYREKASIQLELLGYVDLTTGKEEDRRKLLITDIRPLQGKDGKWWGHAVFTKSIGSGKTARLTLKDFMYAEEPIFKGDIIYASVVEKKKEWWYLSDYRKL
jgi:DNA polymerase III alpha subunit